MTMHEWSKLIHGSNITRLCANSCKSAKLQAAFDILAKLSLDEALPTTNTFNRILQHFTMRHDLPGDIDEGVHETRFKKVMALLGCMEEAPLFLKPNENTFEIAMSVVFLKNRFRTVSEALFQLMQTPRYNLKPTKLCWVYRIAAVVSKRNDSTPRKYYDEFIQCHKLDSYAASLLMKAALCGSAFPFLYDRILPEIEKDKSLIIKEVDLLGWLSYCKFMHPEAVRFIRWVIRTDALNSKSDAYFNESLCWRWLDLIASGNLGLGVSDIAVVAMRRIIHLRSKMNGVPRSYLEAYLKIVENEESGATGSVNKTVSGDHVPLGIPAVELAAHIREQLGSLHTSHVNAAIN